MVNEVHRLLKDVLHDGVVKSSSQYFTVSGGMSKSDSQLFLSTLVHDVGQSKYHNTITIITTDPHNKEDNDDKDIVLIKRKKSKKKPTILELTFLEPPQDGHLNYPELYFHTTQGVLDPEIVIERDPQ